MKKVDYIAHNGQTFKGTCSASPAFKKLVKPLGYQLSLHMRVGHLSITTYTLKGNKGLFVANYYEKHNIDEAGCTISPDSKFWAVHKADRLSQLKLVESLIKGHPLAKQVQADIQIEREYLAQ